MASSSPSPKAPLLHLHRQQDSAQPLSSTLRTFINLILCILGTGVLGLPYTFSRVGWLMGPIVLALSAFLAYRGMVLLISAKHRFLRLHEDLNLPSYGDLMYHTYGSGARMLVDVLLALSTLACGISYLSFIIQNLASIASAVEGNQVSLFSSSPISIGGAPVAATGFEASPVATSTTSYGRGSSVVYTADSGNERSQGFFLEGNRTTSCSCTNGSLQAIAMEANLTTSLPAIAFTVNETSELLARGRSHGFSLISKYVYRLQGFDWTSQYLYACVFLVIGVVLSFIPSITQLAPLSAVANATTITALVTIMVLEAIRVKTAGGFQNIKMFGTLSAVPSAFGVGVYAFQNAGLIIPIETSMAEPWKLGSVLCLAFVLSGTFYVGFSILGYATFGENTQQIITLNLEEGVVALLIKAGLCLSLFIAFPLVLNPVCELMERRFANRKRSLRLRALLVLTICLLGVGVKRFADFLSLAGSSISCLLGFILPAVAHLKVIKEGDRETAISMQIAADYFIIAFGLLFGAAGTYLSFVSFL